MVRSPSPKFADETSAHERPLGALFHEQSVSGVLVYRSGRRRSSNGSGVRSISVNAPILRLNTVCPYYTMFPLAFPFDILRGADPDSLVLDPFCGRGTTTFAARLRGLRTIGVDSNPVAAAVAAAKLVCPSVDSVVHLCREILDDERDPLQIPHGRFWRLCYHPRTLKDVCKLRERLSLQCSSGAEIALRAIVLGILHGPRCVGAPTYLSNQMPRTYATKPQSAIRFWEKNNMAKPPNVDVLDAVSRRAQFALSETPASVGGAVYLGDARRLQELLRGRTRANWIVTSPPYLGLRTYRPDQWLRNWFVGGRADVDYMQDGQLDHHQHGFAEELGRVWASVARVSAPGARLIVRFGSLPSIPVDLKETMRNSFAASRVNWRIERISDAGSAANGKRQSGQFGGTAVAAAREIDVTAVMEA